MATKFSGQVFKLYSGRTPAFRLEGDQIYYNAKTLPAFVSPGAWIEFEAGDLSRSGKGRDVVEGSIFPQTKAAGAAPAQSLGSRDESIQYQSARKDALVMVGLLIANGAVKLPENVAKRAGVIEALVDRFTASYYEDIGDLGALDRADPVEVETPEKVTKKAKKAEVESDDESEDLDD